MQDKPERYELKVTECKYGGPTRVELWDRKNRGYAYMHVETRLTEATVKDAIRWCVAKLAPAEEQHDGGKG